ncbi:metallophosphoesterase [Micromonospora sp. NPDC049559]|uniref:metallophosphoesterase family protein n=1 Tax=Micromonospora sp. NPDC049559 TaxID=3155923 RepID=UPI00342408D9
MALLCDPYLLDPGADRVHVIWHTDTPGGRHVVLVGPGVAGLTDAAARAAAEEPAGAGPGWRAVAAVTSALSRTREDPESVLPGPAYETVRARPVYRQFATVDRLGPGRTPYRVVSVDEAGAATVTPAWSLAPARPGDAPVRLLLSSDHQLKPMVPANLAKVAETVGVELDGVLMAGDMVNVPDRASDWFDHADGAAFFASFTGRADRELAGRRYVGAPILQHTPIFPTIGNHEVMGRWSTTVPLELQFHGAHPRAWDITTYRELFPLPASAEGGPRWWARSIGEVHVVGLFVTHVWRPPGTRGRTKYAEAPEDLDRPERWGHGQFIFEPVHRDSAQYRWLARELASPAARRARYRVVMFHHPGHGLGSHSVPPYTDPVPRVTRDPESGRISAVGYDYPIAEDHVLRDLAPLFDSAGVHLVLNGHSHVWNRFRTEAGVNWLETSNVGNSYGAYDVTSGRVRDAPAGYVGQGDPGGLPPIVPTVAPLTDPGGRPLPFLASNDVTAFSVLDSAAGVVCSYRFDTREPDSPVVLFDEFPLG